jgi:hypothetical protein
VVKLTILPVLATAAAAAADPDPPPLAPDDPYTQEPAPPGMSEPTLAPPGMTPTQEECEADPENTMCAPEYFLVTSCNPNDPAYDPDDPDCYPYTYVVGGIVRHGFGHYFWATHG